MEHEFKIQLFLFAVILSGCSVRSSPLSVNGVTSESRIKLNGNGYEDIVVAISPDVKQEKGSLLIENIKELFRDASAILNRVTKGKFFFKSVRILIPESWTVPNAGESDWETYETSDFRVGPENWEHKGKPFTIHASGCGLPGEYIYLTPDFLKTLKSQSNLKEQPGEAVVREWAKFRYGVLQENAKTLDDLFSDSLSLANLTNEDYSNIISLKSLQNNPQGIVLDDGYIPKKKEITAGAKGCTLRSSWSILQEHPDYEVTSVKSFNIVPSFKIVQLKTARIVLVMDVSWSMTHFNRLRHLLASTERWIRYEISDASYLGLVEFSTKTSNVTPLIPVKGNRDQLVGRLPKAALFRTCIGCGLISGMEVLKNGTESAKGGVLVLISDGEENEKPLLVDTVDKLIASEVRVITIAYGADADGKIELLAKKTGGRSYYINEKNADQVDGYFKDALESVLSYQPAISSDNVVVQIFEQSNQSSVVSGSFDVDSTVGRNLEFSISFTLRTISPRNVKSFFLSSPYSLMTYDKKSLSYSDAGKAKFRLNEAAVGRWHFSLELYSYESVNIEVTTQSRKGVTAPVVTKCFFDEPKEDFGKAAVDDRSSVRVYASVMQGSNPVVQTKKVLAYVQTPTSTKPIEVELSDNPSSPVDAVPGDGIYTGVFFNMSELGRYIVTCVAEDDGGAFVKDGYVSSVGRSNVTRPGSFRRTAAAGSFNITLKIIDNMLKSPPGRITDLRLLALDPEDWQFAIEFTAPGDRLYLGTVKEYEVFYSTSIQELVKVFQKSVARNDKLKMVNENMIVWKSLKPEPAGTTQRVGIKINRNENEEEATYFLVVRGVSSSGIRGSASNVISVRFKLSPLTTSMPETTPPTEEVDEEQAITIGPEDVEELNKDYVYIDGSVTLSASSGIIVLLVSLSATVLQLLF